MRLLSLLCLVLSGCIVGPDFRPPPAGLTSTYMHGGGITSSAPDNNWWNDFNDPLLAALVSKAVANSPDVARAWARIDQSRAAAVAAGAAVLPAIDATGGATAASQSRESAIGRVTRALGIGRNYDEYTVGVQASWEVDLSGGLRRGREAAGQDELASEAAAGEVAISIAAETANAYVTLREQQARLSVAQDQERNQGLLVRLVRQRFDEGFVAERELNRTMGVLAGINASMAPLRASIEAQLNRLDVLLGVQPGTNRSLLISPRPVPAAPMPSGSAMPADLLRRRPDVVAAERRLAASTARIGVAVANYYPRVSLSGLLGLASLGTGQLLTSNAAQTSIGAGLRWRLFDFKRIDAEVAGARGREAEALAAWRSSVLWAAEDVETALARLDASHAQRAALERQVALLTRARDQAHDAFAGGAISLIDVTDADRALLSASDSLASCRAEEARAAIAAYRALGGGWATETFSAIASRPEDRK